MTEISQVDLVVDDQIMLALTLGSFDLKADDGTNTYELGTLSGSSAQLQAMVIDDATGNFTGSFFATSDPDDQSGSAGLQGTTGARVVTILAVADDVNPSSIRGTIGSATIFDFRADAVVLDPTAVPEGDPHVDRALFTLGYVQGVSAGTLMVSAG